MDGWMLLGPRKKQRKRLGLSQCARRDQPCVRGGKRKPVKRGKMVPDCESSARFSCLRLKMRPQVVRAEKDKV